MRQLLLSIVVALVPALAVADVITIGAAKDNTIFSESGSLSNGAGYYLFAGTNGRGDIRRGLLAFDIAASIPGGSTITGVTLRLHQSRTISSSQTISISRLTSDWGEAGSHASGEEGAGAAAQTGDATWTRSFFPGTAWGTSGGDFVAGASASASVAPLVGTYSWSSPTMITDVQGWLDSGSNFGWILRGNEAAAVTAMRFDTRDNLVAANRPSLEIEYTVPEPGSLALLIAGTGLAAARRR